MSWHIKTFLGYSKDFVVFLFPDTFRIQKKDLQNWNYCLVCTSLLNVNGDRIFWKNIIWKVKTKQASLATLNWKYKFEYRKNLETGNWQNPLNTERVWKQENDKIPWIRKVFGNRETTKSLEYGKCLETGKHKILCWAQNVSDAGHNTGPQKQENCKIPWLQKVSRNRKIT